MPSRLAKCEINNRYVSFLHIGTSNSVRMFIKAFIDAELVIVWERFWADWCASMRVSCSFCVTNSIINSGLNGSDAIFFQMIIGSCHLCAFDIKEVFKKVKICVTQWHEIVRSLGIKWMQNGHWVNLKPKDSVNLVEVVWAHLDSDVFEIHATIEMIWLKAGQPTLISYFKNSWICQALFRTCKH